MPSAAPREGPFSARPSAGARLYDFGQTRPRASAGRRLAVQTTEVERKLRARRCAGFEFRRQHPMGPGCADFCCARQRLVIELDGDQPAQADAERKQGLRTALLNQMGYRAIRFSNHQVSCERQAVLDAIYAALINC